MDLEDAILSNSAANLLVLELPRKGNPKLYAKEFDKRGQGRDYTKYYAMYRQKLDGGTAIFSSTLNSYGFLGKPLDPSNLVPFSLL